MVTTTAGQGWTRRTVPVSELHDLDPLAPDVLDHLVQTRLVVVGQHQATITHESLVAAWPRLREWVETRRGDLARREAVTRAAEDWDANDRHPDHLLRGGRLASVAEWRDLTTEPPTPLQEDFVRASVERDEREQVEPCAGIG